MGNPAAPRFFNAGKDPHLIPDATNIARDQEKLAHYRKFTTLTARTPKVYYTFDVETTGRLGPPALAFLQDFYRVAGSSFDHEGLPAQFGPSPLMKLMKRIVPAVAKVNAKLAQTYVQFTSRT
eukprot:gene13562-biopygen7323